MAKSTANNDIRLREVIEDDLPIFYEQQLDPDATAMADFPSREREAFMAHWAKIRQVESGIHRTILFGDEVAGNIVSWLQDGQREVGYWLGKPYWGKGIATAALSQLLEIVTERPLYAYVVKHNLGSIRVLEKCGFQRVDENDEEIILKLD
jgi:RimJ/RimL family protein N-acetyltransferase